MCCVVDGMGLKWDANRATALPAKSLPVRTEERGAAGSNYSMPSIDHAGGWMAVGDGPNGRLHAEDRNRSGKPDNPKAHAPTSVLLALSSRTRTSNVVLSATGARISGLGRTSDEQALALKAESLRSGGAVSTGHGTPHDERRNGNNQHQRQHHKPGAEGWRQASSRSAPTSTSMPS